MYANGKSYNAIIDALNGDIKKADQLVKTIYAILRNDRYIGIYTWNRRKVKVLGKWAGGGENPNVVRIPNAIPKIIDENTWNLTQARVNDNSGKTRYCAKRTYLLSGLIECASCGSIYSGRTTVNSRGYESAYYVCLNKFRTRVCLKITDF